ncbi:MAG: membrane dipeptidase [Verrucomicrobiota bacterium]
MNPSRPSRRRFIRSITGLSLLGLVQHPFTIGVPAADASLPFATDNETIQKARDVALGILKPSRKDLEHGLKLHAASLVIDSYGFAPRCAIDGDAFRRRAEAGASAADLTDLREEMMMTRNVASETERKEFLDAWRAGGVSCIVQNAGEEGNDPIRLLKRLARYTHVTDRVREVAKAATPDDIAAAHRAGRLSFYLTGNGVPLRQLWNSVDEETSLIRVFYQLGIRMMHLTYNRRNPIGDGCAEPANGGLSEFGKAVVAEMNRVGVIADVAHSGWQTSLDAAKASKRPMVASHTACAALHRHIRGKPDEVIRAICDTGGLVGICCIPSFLGGAGDISVFLDHIDYVAKKFGVDHVAIGTDVAYVSRNSAAENKKAPGFPGTARWEALWPPDAFVNRPVGAASLSWTNWPLFTVGLVQRGYRDTDIQKILGGNFLRVARGVLA